MADEKKPSPVVVAANALAESINADIFLFSGEIERPYDDRLLDMISDCEVNRENCLLVLCTHGGNPDAAYRIARSLQNEYEKFTVLLAGRCKSAGTLLVIGASEIAMTPHAELGPLDVQVGKKDELVGLDSGLTVLDALNQLESKAFALFEDAMLRIVQSSGGRVTFKTATHIAVELSKGMVAPIMAQIDPMHIGEVSRALKIGEEYGSRLDTWSSNLKEGALKNLVHGYPSHGFVIDNIEASRLFNHVREATPLEITLLSKMEGSVRIPSSDEPLVGMLSTTQSRKETTNDTDNERVNEPAGADTASGSASA